MEQGTIDILVQKAKTGDKHAFEELYKEYYTRIYRYCTAHLFYKDALAQDVCQETFLKAWKALPTFTLDHGGTFQAFLFRIARNLLIDLSRKKKEVRIEQVEEIENNEDLLEAFDRKAKIQQVQSVLAKLPDMDRQIITLRYFEDLSHAEVAQIIGTKQGALRVRTIRLLKKLKALLQSL